MNHGAAGTLVLLEKLEARALFAGTPAGNVFTQTNLVSDGFVSAAHTDTDLKNPWGISFAPGSPWWVSDNATSKSTLYDSAGVKQALIVNIPGAGNSSSAPTGQVSNPTSAFIVKKGAASAAAQFIFAGEDGGITGWNANIDATNAVLAVDNSASGAVYKGLAMGTVKHKPRLYAANFHSGQVEMYDGTFKRVTSKTAFADNKIAAGYAPFNVQNLNGLIYVTYAKQDAAAHDDVSGKGHGFVDVFSSSGTLLRRFVRGKYLNSPWGLAIAPSSFGPFAGDVLVGQFGSGVITAINPKSGKLVGTLADSKGAALHNSGLWALAVGNNGTAGSSNTLFFTAGLNGEKDGLLGSIQIST